MKIILPGTPIAQQRPRFGKYGNVYDPQSTAKQTLGIIAKSQMLQNGLYMLPDAATSVEVYAYSPPPSSWPQKRLKCVEGQFITTKPDIDNIAKAILDILSGIAYSDDKWISRLICEKRYSQEPRTEINISTLGDQND